VSEGDGDLIIDFADTGGGIPRELEGKIFEPFSTAGKVGGTGLGLTMVRQIADEHRGHVSYESDPKHGTRFTFRLPL
jgi:signal transduction histidine kinase